jgi:hypothetical protein
MYLSAEDHAMIDQATKLAVIEEMIQTSKQRCEEIDLEQREEARFLKRLYEERSRLVHGVQTGHASAPSNGDAESIPYRVAAVMQAHNGPMRARDIAQELKNLGVETESEKGLLPNVLSALGRRKDLFRRVDRGTYVLCERRPAS